MKYQVDISHPYDHIVKIELNFTTKWDDPILEMPVWTPGSYKVRDYSKHVHQFKSFSEDKSISNKKISKNQWQIIVREGNEVKIKYYVYAHDFTVRTSYLNDDYGLLSPASLFFYIVDSKRNHNKLDPIQLSFNLPDNWKILTSLKKEGDMFYADDFDELVDSPFGVGKNEVVHLLDYKILNTDNNEIPCTIALIGYRGNHDIEKFRDELIKLQEKSIEMFGSLPYDRYLWVLYIVQSGGGGLEHKYSNFSIINRWYFKGNDMNYAKLLSLEAHEHFHAYNIKRIRPTQLGPFEYDREVYTTLLWVAEGITSFYDNIFLPRTKIISEKTYWKVIENDYTNLLKNYGRFETSISESSFDAWIKLYQPHTGSHNLFVSYYLKGGLVAFMLDLEIRNQTSWLKSLDDFFKQMYKAYQLSSKTYNEENFRLLIEEATDTELTDFWNKYINGTEELPFNDYLNLIGMKLVSENSNEVYFGIDLKSNSNTILKVYKNSPAYHSGLSPTDKLISINRYEVTKSTFSTLLKNSESGDVFHIHYIRDGILKETELVVGDPIVDKYRIVEMQDINEDIQKRKNLFLHLN